MMINPTARRLVQYKELILVNWEREIQLSFIEFKSLNRLNLIGCFPAVLKCMVRILNSSNPKQAIEREEPNLAKGHGKLRSSIPQYSSDKIVQEFFLMQKATLTVLESNKESLHLTDRDLILEVISIALKRTVAEYTSALRETTSQFNADLKDELGGKIAESNLKSQLLKTIFARVDDYAIFSLDAAGHITSWANGAQRIKQYTSADVLGRHFSMLYPKEGRLRKEPESHLVTALREGRFRGEGMRQKKDGSLFLADVFITPMFEGEDLIGFFKIVADLTERSRIFHERDLSQMRVESLEAERELREQFVYTLSHDLKNPLTAAGVSAQLIARQHCNLERHHELALRAEKGFQRAEQMVTNFLDASRIRAGHKCPLQFGTCDLVKIICEVKEELRTIYGDRIQTKLPDSLVGNWDCQGLSRVIGNLADNAIKYGDSLRTVTIVAQEFEDRVHLKVHNFGAIISVNEFGNLFESFRRLDSSEKSPVKGWGLGLTLVRGITEAHGGNVQVKSLPNEGTTFTIDLPRNAHTVGNDTRLSL